MKKNLKKNAKSTNEIILHIKSLVFMTLILFGASMIVAFVVGLFYPHIFASKNLIRLIVIMSSFCLMITIPVVAYERKGANDIQEVKNYFLQKLAYSILGCVLGGLIPIAWYLLIFAESNFKIFLDIDLIVICSFAIIGGLYHFNSYVSQNRKLIWDESHEGE